MNNYISFDNFRKALFESDDSIVEDAAESIIENLKMFKDIYFSATKETNDYFIIALNSEHPDKARNDLSSYKFSHATNLIIEPVRKAKGDGWRLIVYDEDGDPFDKDLYIQIRKGGQYNAGVENEMNFIDVLKNAGTQSIKFKDKNGKELVLKNVESIRDCSKDPGSRKGNRGDVEIITDGKPFRISLKKDTAYKAAGVKNRFKPQAFKIGKIVRKYFIDNDLAFEDFPYITIPITNSELYRWCVFGNDMKNEGAVIQSAFSKDDVIEQINKPAIYVDKILTPDEDDKTLMEEFPVCLLLSISKRGGVEVRSAVIGEFARRYFKDDLIIPGVNDNSITESMQDRKYGIFNGYHIYTDMDENNIFHTCYKIKDFGVSRDNYARHSCISGDNSIYGSMSYFGFDTAEDAKNYIESKWSSHHNFDKCMKKLNANELTESFVNEAQSPIERLGWAIINEINEDNFIHEMRFKDTNVEDVDTEKNSATLFWMTQEGFDGYDFNQFMKEVRRAALAVSPRAKKYKISEPVTFKVLAVCRDGKWAGYGTRKITVG